MEDNEKIDLARGMDSGRETPGKREQCAICTADIHPGHQRSRDKKGRPAHPFCVNSWQVKKKK